jgi:hypothetical protein
MYRKFYTGQFLGADFREFMESYIEGNQPYLNLKKKLFLSVPSVAWDLVSGRQ